MMATARWVTTINEDGNGATGDKVDDDGNDDDCGDGQRHGRWRRRDVFHPIATGNDNNDVNGDSAMGNEVDDDGDGATGDENDNDHDSDGDDNSGMGSNATGYDDDGDEDGDGRDNNDAARDDNDAATTMATAHQAGYYAHLFLIGKNVRHNGDRRQRQRGRPTMDNEDGNSVTGIKVEDDGDDDNCGNGRRRQRCNGRWHNGIRGRRQWQRATTTMAAGYNGDGDGRR